MFELDIFYHCFIFWKKNYPKKSGYPQLLFGYNCRGLSIVHYSILENPQSIEFYGIIAHKGNKRSNREVYADGKFWFNQIDERSPARTRKFITREEKSRFDLMTSEKLLFIFLPSCENHVRNSLMIAILIICSTNFHYVYFQGLAISSWEQTTSEIVPCFLIEILKKSNWMWATSTT